METSDLKVGPFSDASPRQYPRVCRFRRLKLDGTLEIVREETGFNWQGHQTLASPDGQFFVVVGQHQELAKSNRLSRLRVYDGITARELWANESDIGHPVSGPARSLDPLGRELAHLDGTEEHTVLRDLATGRTNRLLTAASCIFTSDGSYALATGRPAPFDRGVVLAGNAGQKPLVSFDLEANRVEGTTASWSPVFSRDGALVAWGNGDGTVSVARIADVRHQLGLLGLDW
jgi:hypothetical protein